jgi:N-acetylglucosaminyldiphosphoundecaprenol N-acetyl-beta-D-mannosaminyltransferase
MDDLIASERSKLVVTANLDFHRVADEDPEMQRILYDADIMMADGFPMVKLSSLFGPQLRERVTGSDITPMLAEHAAKKGHRLFFLGAAPGVAQKAADILTERHPGLNVVGCYSPDKADVVSMKSEIILQQLEETKPDVLLVAFGAPKQEKWIQMHRDEWKVPVSMGIGGSFDFIAGAQMRSPVWMQKLGLEWLGRMLANPKRLAGRYMQDGLFLLGMIARLTAIRTGPRGRLSIPLQQTDEGKKFDELNAVSAEMKPVKTLEDAEREVARLQELSRGKNLVVRPESTAWLSSVELGVLVLLSRFCRQQSRSLVVYSPSRKVRKLLDVQGLNNCFCVADDPGDVVEQLKLRNEESMSASVSLNEAGSLLVALPAELTAVNKPDVASQVFQRWEERPKEVVVDASPMRFIDCGGLSLLVAMEARARQKQVPFKLSGFQDNVKKIIKVNNLDQLLES